MSFNLIAVCDLCGPGWWNGYVEDQPTYASRGDALKNLPLDHQWLIEKDPDGTYRMLCTGCAQLERCKQDGHSWVPLEYAHAGLMAKYGEVCSVCAAVHSHDEPPAGHPDSMTAVLSDADEEWLAALDAVLDPDHANEEV